MDLLFGEQQVQNNQERVKFKAQEQSLNPCYVEYKNSEKLKQGENYYFFQLNEMGEELKAIEHLEPLYDDWTQNQGQEKNRNKLRESSPDMMQRLRLPPLNNDPDGLKRQQSN